MRNTRFIGIFGGRGAEGVSGLRLLSLLAGTFAH